MLRSISGTVRVADTYRLLPTSLNPCGLILHADGRMFPHDDVSNCWFVAQDPEAAAKWSDYLFMTSIQFLVQREMVEIAPRSAIRLDTCPPAECTVISVGHCCLMSTMSSQHPTNPPGQCSAAADTCAAAFQLMFICNTRAADRDSATRSPVRCTQLACSNAPGTTRSCAQTRMCSSRLGC